MLVDLFLMKPINFSTCDPDGNADQVNTFALIIAYFPESRHGKLGDSVDSSLLLRRPFCGDH